MIGRGQAVMPDCVSWLCVLIRYCTNPESHKLESGVPLVHCSIYLMFVIVCGSWYMYSFRLVTHHRSVWNAKLQSAPRNQVKYWSSYLKETCITLTEFRSSQKIAKSIRGPRWGVITGLGWYKVTGIVQAELPQGLCIQWSLRFKTPLFNNSLHFKTGYQCHHLYIFSINIPLF